MGWFPDYPDGDNYLQPGSMRDGGFFQNGYCEQGRQRRARQGAGPALSRRGGTAAFDKIQEAEAKDVPLIPIWEGKQVAAIRDGV